MEQVIGMVFRGKYWFLSNFYPCEISMGGRTYNSVEAAFQGTKACMCERFDVADEIASIPKGESYEEAVVYGVEAKKFGRSFKMTQRQREQWSACSLERMGDALRQKFMDPRLASKLVAVKGEIAESTGHRKHPDRIWGVDAEGKGENRLGKLLMAERERCERRLAKEDERPFSELAVSEMRGDTAVVPLIEKSGEVSEVTVSCKSLHPLSEDDVTISWEAHGRYAAGRVSMEYGHVMRLNQEAQAKLELDAQRDALVDAEPIAVDVCEDVWAQAEVDKG